MPSTNTDYITSKICMGLAKQLNLISEIKRAFIQKVNAIFQHKS